MEAVGNGTWHRHVIRVSYQVGGGRMEAVVYW